MIEMVPEVVVPAATSPEMFRRQKKCLPVANYSTELLVRYCAVKINYLHFARAFCISLLVSGDLRSLELARMDFCGNRQPSPKLLKYILH